MAKFMFGKNLKEKKPKPSKKKKGESAPTKNSKKTTKTKAHYNSAKKAQTTTKGKKNKPAAEKKASKHPEKQTAKHPEKQTRSNPTKQPKKQPERKEIKKPCKKVSAKKREKRIEWKKVYSKILVFAGELVEAVDEINEEALKIGAAGVQLLFPLCAGIVSVIDMALDILAWFVIKTIVLSGRHIHEIRLAVIKHKKAIIRDATIVVLSGVFLVGVFAWATDYEYSYNGRVLGIVKDQNDVLEILDVISEELSLEYGSNIEINPETDISFKPVVSYGKEIDDTDAVLRRFTYMGEIQAKAYAIKANDKILAVVENERIANQVLDNIKSIYLSTADNVEYEYIGFVEDVKIEPYSTKLTNVSSLQAAVEKIKNGGQEVVPYTVEAGDSLYAICDKLGVTLEELKEMNPGLTDSSLLHAGDQLNCQRLVPLLTLETVEVATLAESIPYKTEYTTSSYYYEGEAILSRAGVNGKARVTARLTKNNGQIVAREDISKETLIEPISEVIVKGTKPVPPKKGTGTFIRPVNVGIYSPYGYRWGQMHDGVDLAAPSGTPIKAADGGTVIKAGWHVNYGYMIIIDHGGNTETLYAHCSKLYVSAGERVFQGQTIAAVGSTGRSTGPHCHFEIWINGRTVNPAHYC